MTGVPGSGGGELVLTCRDLRKRFGDAGRARVLPRYAVDRLVDDVDRLYRALLSEGAGEKR